MREAENSCPVPCLGQPPVKGIAGQGSKRFFALAKDAFPNGNLAARFGEQRGGGGFLVGTRFAA